jgi:hypothetical protein
MMNYFRNENGIALAMVLVLSLISLVVVSGLLFMATQGTKLSGSHKFFRTAEEASFGGVENVAEYVQNRGTFNLLGVPHANGCDCGDPDNPTDNLDNNEGPPARTCRCDKLCNSTVDWPVAGVFSCDENGGLGGLQISLNPADPATAADMQYLLGIAPQSFDVFSKIVDTVQGNSDVGGIVTSGSLGGGGVVASNAGLINPPHAPYLYRLEVQAQETANPREVSRISVLYAF